mgnify:CR=1 FL=1
MFDDILTAIPFGIILAFTIGPVFFVLLETSATKGFKSALIFDSGVMLADIIFIFVAFFFKQKIISFKVKNKIIYGLTKIAKEISNKKFEFNKKYEDIFFNV